MRIRSLFVMFFVLVACAIFCQDTGSIKNYTIGETIVPVHSKRFGRYGLKVTFINLHDNEQTSVKAAEAYLTACGGGTLVHIINEQTRLINICLVGKPYTFDPNRIYSEAGRNNTLQILSENFEDTAQCEVALFAHQLLKQYISSSRLVIAIHNNNDSALSVLSYRREQADKKHTGSVFINPAMDIDDFMLTPDYVLFKKIKARNINVVWENTKLINNDGSLSAYAGLHKIPYINVEAQHDHGEEQLNMLNALDDIIKGYVRKKKESSRNALKSSYEKGRIKVKKYK